MAEYQPIGVEPVPVPIIQSLGKVLRDRFSPYIPRVEEGLQQMSAKAAEPNAVTSVVAAHESELDLVGYIDDLAHAEQAHLDVYNESLRRLRVAPSPTEDFLPNGLDLELAGPDYVHLIDALDHEVLTRLQLIKRAQVVQKLAPDASLEVTDALSGIEHELDDLNEANGMRLVSEQNGSRLDAIIHLYTSD